MLMLTMSTTGHGEVAQLLVQSRADLNTRNDKTEQGQGCTALHFAVLNQQMQMVKLLVSLGAKTDIPMKDGKTVDMMQRAA